MPFWKTIKSIQLLRRSQNLLNLEDFRIWMFTSDFCKCCYQSYMGSLKEYQFAANGKCPEQRKHKCIQKSQIQVQFECDFETWHHRWISLPLHIVSILFLTESFEKPWVHPTVVQNHIWNLREKKAWCGREFLCTTVPDAGFKAAFAHPATLSWHLFPCCIFQLNV